MKTAGTANLTHFEYSLVHSNRSHSCFRDLRDATHDHRVQTQGDYRCISKVSKQLRDLLECNVQLRLWVHLSVTLYEIKIFDEF